MKLTKKKAIEISIELWTWLAETGAEGKADWVGWGKYELMQDDCPLCEYASRKCKESEDEELCDNCPLADKFGHCLETAYEEWDWAKEPNERKKYASQFLEQLRTLK